MRFFRIPKCRENPNILYNTEHALSTTDSSYAQTVYMCDPWLTGDVNSAHCCLYRLYSTCTVHITKFVVRRKTIINGRNTRRLRCSPACDEWLLAERCNHRVHRGCSTAAVACTQSSWFQVLVGWPVDLMDEFAFERFFAFRGVLSVLHRTVCTVLYFVADETRWCCPLHLT